VDIPFSPQIGWTIKCLVTKLKNDKIDNVVAANEDFPWPSVIQLPFLSCRFRNKKSRATWFDFPDEPQ